jgi:predicted metal-dependent HD superfamily phosphohydrolase
MPHDALARRWLDLLPDAHSAFDDLVRRYAEPSRHYHTLAHIASVLEVIDRLVSHAPPALVLAAWYHDAVYDSRAGDNEERSAELARHALAGRVGDGVCDEVARLILLTTSHTASADDHVGQVLLDADLAVLGAERDIYDAYARAIRQEYAWVNEPDYRTGRRRVLQRFLGRPVIYFTRAMRAQAEGQARANLAREIAALA